ncbi:MAG TPA: hypothetical protein VF941_17600 [Clostridia bacterium]
MFQDQVINDIKIFFADFATQHIVNGKTMDVIVDNDQLMQRSKKEFDGISVGELLFYVKVSDFGPKPSQNSIIKFDKKLMAVFDVREVDGIYEIILQQNRSA